MSLLSIRVVARAMLDVMAPQHCALCDLPSIAALCAGCLAELPMAATRCRRCAVALGNAGVCGRCLVEPPPFDAAHAGCEYAFPVDALLARFKYQADLSLLPSLSVLVQKLAVTLPAPRGLLVPVPLHPARQRERGFNQSSLLARSLAASSELQFAPGILRRRLHTTPQVGLPAAERAENVRDAFVALGDFAGARVWLFDDVMTTGATLGAAARALLRAGAVAVNAVALARSADAGQVPL